MRASAMDVPSFAFLGFAVLAALAINARSAPTWRRAVLLVANLAFVLSFTRDPRALAPFAGFVAFGFAALHLVARYRQRGLFVAALAAAIAALAWIKHYAFVPAALALPSATFAVGVSYVFFRIVHLIVDAYQEALPDRVGLISYLNYTLNFTALVSGPIQLYGAYRRSESVAPAPLNGPALGIALERIVLGFFKVAVVSPPLLALHGRAVGALAAATPLDRIGLGAIVVALYPVYLYVNFSGYTDFVIGVARLLRLELPENFDRPFFAEGFIAFWSRWHMTLSNWLKTYVYGPLLLALMRRFPSPRVEPWLAVAVYFVTFFLIGVWHGQTAMFLVYGVLQGLGVSGNKLYQLLMQRRLGRKGYRALCARPAYRAVSRGLTFSYFAFSMLWFWNAGSQLRALAGSLGVGGSLGALALDVAAASVVLAAAVALVERAPQAAPRFGYVRAGVDALLFGVTASVVVLLDAPAAHLVYRAF